MFPILRVTCLALVCASFFFGCSDQTKHQAEYRGTWHLDSRQLPTGQELQAPAQVSGLMEWYPIAPDKAHVMISQTDTHQAIQVINAVYTLHGNGFTTHSHVRIGGALGAPIDDSYQTDGQQSTGTIASDDARKTLNHGDGTRFEFIGAQLTITYPNGIVDRWKHQKDQKGALPN